MKIAPELRALKFKFKRARVCGPTYERTKIVCVFIYIFSDKKTKKKEKASLPPCNLTRQAEAVWCVSALARPQSRLAADRSIERALELYRIYQGSVKALVRFY